MKDPEFIRYASYTMGLYIDRMKKISTLFNIGGRDRFTPRDMLHLVALNDFGNIAEKINLSAFINLRVTLKRAVWRAEIVSVEILNHKLFGIIQLNAVAA